MTIAMKEATHTTISGLFSEIHPIRIPPYQRSFSWEIKQVDQFLLDLEEQHRSGYYLGQILFEEASDIHFVVDGQQRLTTICLFMAAIAMVLQEEKRSSSDGISQEIDSVKKFLGRNFQTIAEDQILFKKITQRFISPPIDEAESISQKRLIQAVNLFVSKLGVKSNEEIVLLRKNLENSVVTAIFLQPNQATQVFEYQNNRGKELTRFEIIKAFLIHNIYMYSRTDEESVEHIAEVKNIASAIYRNLDFVEGFFSENDLLDITCRLFYKTESRIEAFKENISSENSKIEWIKAWFSNYQEITQSARGIVRAINKHPFGPEIMNLFLLGDEVNWKIVLIAIFNKSETDHPQFKGILKAVEILGFKIKVGGYRSDRLPGYAIEYFNSPRQENPIQVLSQAIVTASKEGFQWYWNQNQAFENILWDYFERDRFHYHSDIIKYVLWLYENDMRTKAKSGLLLSLDAYKDYTIEHIAPQKPAKEKYSKEFEETCLHLGGNLALLTKEQNSRFNNKSFEEKKELFQETTLATYTEIRRNSVWGEKEILKRHTDLTSFIRLHFKIES
ncbi:MAG: DUF262 domain-containing protein [Candidatus Riflebacteria bacterium]|nr:DUF262 domain-containing protein [Candidatus Riflebacteria bacterium]